MFKVLLPKYKIEISLDSNDPDVSAILEFDGDPTFLEIIREKVNGMSGMSGMYGHRIGEETTPLDLNAALAKSIYEFQILEGAEILKMPRQELPPGDRW